MSGEQVFTNFTPEQAAAYAKYRALDYPRPLYDKILEFHQGECHVALDVGTGPGIVAFSLLQSFAKCLGCDPGESMISQAKATAQALQVEHRTDFAVCRGEQCDQAFPDDKVDLITVAMAAHWLDMPAFYASAAKCLRPSGTLAMWTCSSMFVHPSNPNHKEIQKILSHFEDEVLAPYMAAGTFLSHFEYRDLMLPWTIPETNDSYEQTSFRRISWDSNGAPSAPAQPDGTPGPFLVNSTPKSTISTFSEALGSSSSVIRWREAHPELAHTDQDAVSICAKELRQANGGEDELWLSPSLTLLLLRRR